MKKTISLLLSLIMVFSLALPAFAQAEAEEYPTVYVTGAQTNNIYSADGRRIYPVEGDIMATAKEALAPCMEKFALGKLTGDYTEFAKELNKHILGIYGEVMLDEKGEASDGSHPQYHSSTIDVSDKKSGYGMWDFRFWYDWRISPIVTAEELKNYIDRVVAATGKDKVQLAGRCYGANVIQAYVTLHKDHALKYVSDVSYFASSVSGIDFMSALFSGEIAVEEQALTNFVEYYMENEGIIEDDALALLVFSLVELFNQVKVLGLGTDAIEDVFEDIKGYVLPEVLPSVVGRWPSYWAMVNPELYEKSIEFIFGKNREEYKEFIEKTDYYHYNVQLCAEETILELQEKGINFCIFSKYGFPDMPLYEGATAEGDTYTCIPKQSFGAVASDYGEVLSADYIDSLEDKTYLSPDFKINAATALLPERSWFIKNLHHNEFEVLHNMALEIMRYDLTVDNEKYPQYLYHENAVITPLEGTDADYNKAPASPAQAMIRFLSALLKVLTKLLKGEISLNFSGLLG